MNRRYSVRVHLALIGAASVAVAGFTFAAAGALLLRLAEAVLRSQEQPE